MLLSLGYGIYNLIIGGMFLILLAFGFKAKTFWPLTLGLIIFGFDAVMMVQQLIAFKMANNVGPIFVRVMLIIPWVKGCQELFKKRRS